MASRSRPAPSPCRRSWRREDEGRAKKDRGGRRGETERGFGMKRFFSTRGVQSDFFWLLQYRG